MTEWPPVLERVAREISPLVAWALADRWGGRRLYIPRQIPDDHPLVAALGRENAERLAEMFGHGEISIPLGPRTAEARTRRMIEDAVREGHSTAEIARRLGCSERTVYAARARLRAERR